MLNSVPSKLPFNVLSSPLLTLRMLHVLHHGDVKGIPAALTSESIQNELIFHPDGPIRFVNTEKSQIL